MLQSLKSNWNVAGHKRQPGDQVNILLVDLRQRLYRRRRFEAAIVNQSDDGS